MKVASSKPIKKPKPTTSASKAADAKIDHPLESKIVRGQSTTSAMALTVRVEVNLPPGGDQQTYDAIFKSIREHLLNGNAT